VSASKGPAQRRPSSSPGAIPRSWLIAILVVVAAAALGVILAIAMAPPRGGPSGSTILEMSGNGNKTSDPFYARPGWSVNWENSGKYFSYTIHGDVEFGQVVTQNGPGNGITSPVPTGNFFIEVVAQGPWSLRVIQGE
jgi:hypothetical protein